MIRVSGLGESTLTPAPGTLEPAVPIRRSVQRDHVVCLECGYRGQVLRRHLRVAHGLDPAAYRVRWKLPVDHPITAPAYSERRSTMAKEIGLGRGARDVAISTPAPEVIAPLPAQRRGRKPRAKRRQTRPRRLLSHLICDKDIITYYESAGDDRDDAVSLSELSQIRATRARTRAMKAARAAVVERSRSYCARKNERT
jgi:ROS/MUCR transcriptional regulator protein